MTLIIDVWIVNADVPDNLAACKPLSLKSRHQVSWTSALQVWRAFSILGNCIGKKSSVPGVS
jgi:hypothetical protein